MTDDMSLRPRPGESAEDVVERVTRAARAKSEEDECPNGHGPMIFYPSTPEEDKDDFFECPDCGHQEELPGQRSAEEGT
jgi:hypothetical protein